MLFQYQKLTINGQIVNGTEEFLSKEDAEKQLIDSGELLVFLRPAQKERKHSLTLEQKTEFTFQLFQLISAGLPIYESLLSLKEKQLVYESIICRIADEIQKGQSISHAFKSSYHGFGYVYLAILQAAENSGELKEGFCANKDLLEKQVKLLKTLKNAFTYPGLLLCFAVIIIHVMLLFVIPSLQDLFEGREIGTITKIVLSFSHLFKNYLSIIISSYVVFIGICYYLRNNEKIKRFFSKTFVNFRLIKKVIEPYRLQNLFYCLSMMLKRGINLKEALELSREILKNTTYEDSINYVIDNLLIGKKFSESITSDFPPIVKRFLSLSESTGQLASACQTLSEIFETDLEKKLQKFTAFLQPALLGLIGLIVGIVILAILLPLTDTGNLNL